MVIVGGRFRVFTATAHDFVVKLVELQFLERNFG
jgi:hypothetical protein